MAKSKSRLFSFRNIFLVFVIIAALSTLMVLAIMGNSPRHENAHIGLERLKSALVGEKSHATFDGVLSGTGEAVSDATGAGREARRSNPPSSGGGGGGSLVTGPIVSRAGSEPALEFAEAGDTKQGCRTVDAHGTGRLVDSAGQICTYEDMISKTGCCPSSGGEGKRNFQASAAEMGTVRFGRHTCTGCDQETGCCVSLDVCISCCLHPESLDQAALTFTGDAGTLSPVQLFVYRDLWAAGRQFEYCSYRCRTSSGSVQHENSYRGGQRYCFDVFEAPMQLPTVNSDRQFAVAVDPSSTGSATHETATSAIMFGQIPRETG